MQAHGSQSYPQGVYPRGPLCQLILNFREKGSNYVNRFEKRRFALKAIVDEMGRGGRATVAKQIGTSPSYIARLLYPPGKEGRKNIGDEMVDAITRVYPHWLEQQESEAVGQTRLPAMPRAMAPERRSGSDYIDFAVYSPRPGELQRVDVLPAVAEHMELAAWEVQRKLGYMPEPGRIQLFTHRGPSMRPILEDGDIAFIDTLVTQFAGDDCYLACMGGDIQVKMLQRRGPDLWVVSQNPDYPPWRCSEESDIIVCGRVVLRACLRPV